MRLTASMVFSRGDYEFGMRVRTVVIAACALVAAVLLVGVAFSAVDRARERRRATARLVAVGVPPRILQLAQLWQVGVPLAVSVAAGGVLGTLLTEAYFAMSDVEAGKNVMESVAQNYFVVAVAAGCTLVLGLTVASARVRLTPELLRED